MMISTICKVRPDHYSISHLEGTIQLHSIVQDYSWQGVLVVIRFVAENEQEVVIESVGRDELGYQITRFLVLKKEWVDRPKRGIEQFWGLPKALDQHWYRSRGCVGNDVSVPYFRHPFSTSSFSFLSFTDSEDTHDSSLSFSIFSNVSWCL
jgi:hypothetical protein